MNILKADRIRKIQQLVEGVYRYNFLKDKKILPRSLMINLTYKCNSKCIMCNIWKIKPKNEVTYEKWQEIMKDKIFSDIRNLTISGGEPILYADYVKSIKLFVDSMPKLRRLVLNTNGFLPKKIEESVREVAEYCEKRSIKVVVSVSIDGVESVHDNLRRIPGGFKKVVETISRLKNVSKDSDLIMGVSTVIMRQNIKNYWAMKKWLLKNELKGSFQLVGFIETFLNNIESKKILDINEKVKQSFLEVLVDIKNGCGWLDPMSYYWEDMLAMYGKGSFRTTPCPFLIDDFVVDSLGDVYYCLSVKPIGNFLKENREVWKIYFDPKNTLYRKKLSKNVCQKCNSACNVTNSIAFDSKRLLWYKVTGRLWVGKNI